MENKNLIPTNEQIKEAEEKAKARSMEQAKGIADQLEKMGKNPEWFTGALDKYVDKLQEEKERQYKKDLEEANKKAQEEIDKKYRKDPVTEALRQLSGKI